MMKINCKNHFVTFSFQLYNQFLDMYIAYFFLSILTTFFVFFKIKTNSEFSSKSKQNKTSMRN